MKDRYKLSQKEYEILKKRAHLLAQKTSDLKEKQEVAQIICFSLANEWYGLKIEHVQSILKVGKIAILPFTPEFLVGIINVRGKITSLVDLSKFFSLGEATISCNTRIILVQLNNLETGFLVDNILGLKEIKVEKIEPPLVTLERAKSQYILGEFKLENNFLAILDLPAILESDKWASLG